MNFKTLRTLKIVIIHIVFTTSFFNHVYAQEQNSIIGIVTDESDNLLEGNILLLKPNDSVLVKGAFFTEGKINFENINLTIDQGLLRISSLGYEDYEKIIDKQEIDNGIDIGIIKLKESTLDLDEVLIQSKAPLFKTSPDGVLTVNVNETMLSSSINTMEILSKSPNVLVNDNSISVVGKGAALLYLNGKQISIERLGSIPVNRIDNVEVITNPSAKYDAEGRAVINITTINSENVGGTMVNVNHSVTKGEHFISYSAVNLDYSKNNWSISGDYSVRLGRDWNQYRTTKQITTNEGIITSNNNSEDNTRITYSSNYRMGVGYKINSKSDLSLEYEGLKDVFDLDIATDNSVLAPNDLEISRLQAVNNGETINTNDAFSLNYNTKLDTLGSSLFAGASYSFFKGGLDDFIEESDVVVDTRAFRKIVGVTDISLLTSQLDYSKVFKGGSTLEGGIKYANAVTKGDINFLSRQDGEDDFLSNPLFINNFRYEENIPAAYVQYSVPFKKKWHLKIGARSEYTNAKGVSEAFNETVIDTNYINLFPNASINYKVSDNVNVNLAHSSRIRRPKYQDLNPFIWYQDSLTFQQGNPRLIPEITRAFEGTISYKKHSLKVGYNDTKDLIRSVLLRGQAGPNSVVKQQVNIEKNRSYFVATTMSFNYGVWSSFNTARLTFSEIIDDRPQFQSEDITPQLYVYSYNSFDIKNVLELELQAIYEGDRNDGVYRNEEKYLIALGATKSFLDKSLTLSFVANDLFRLYDDIGSYEIGAINYNYSGRWNINYYRFSLVYKFGNLKKKNYKNKSVGKDEFKRIKQ